MKIMLWGVVLVLSVLAGWLFFDLKAYNEDLQADIAWHVDSKGKVLENACINEKRAYQDEQ